MVTRAERRWQHNEADKMMRQARKHIKRSGQAKQSKPRKRVSRDRDELDELEVAPVERVMPRGEQERRKSVWKATLADLQEGERGPEDVETGLQGPRGIVVEVSSSLCRVDLGGRVILCGLRGSLSAGESGFTNVVAVGDEVVVSGVDSQAGPGGPRGIVEAVLPRRSILARPDVFYGHLQQVVVANADQLLVVASWREPPIWLELIDRYLIAAERYSLDTIICVNKIDLAEGQDAAICRAEMQPYLDLGCRVLFTSAVTGAGIRDLDEVLRDRTTVLAGMSGVGKSSLLAAVQPGLQLRTGDVSEHSGEGRHTTTQVRLLKLEGGGYVVDTPGIREFGLSGLRRTEVAAFYPEMADLAPACRFGDCLHLSEPGCAVRAGLEQGRVSEARYHSYTKILDSLPE